MLFDLSLVAGAVCGLDLGLCRMSRSKRRQQNLVGGLDEVDPRGDRLLVRDRRGSPGWRAG